MNADYQEEHALVQRLNQSQDMRERCYYAEKLLKCVTAERDALREEVLRLDRDGSAWRQEHTDQLLRDDRDKLADLWEWLDSLPDWYQKGGRPGRLNCCAGKDCPICERNAKEMARRKGLVARLREQATTRDEGEA